MKFYRQDFLKKNKIAVIILVRLNSKRLKNKALLKIHKFSVIELLVKRLTKFLSKRNIFICTDKKKNHELKKISDQNNINFFKGDEKNIFNRIIDLRKVYKFNHFVRVTGDNPFTSISAIKKMALTHVKGSFDYTYTNSLPVGTRSEIISYKSLIKANNLALDPKSSEYMTYFFKRKIFKIKNVLFKKKNLNQNFFEVTIDRKKDLNNIIKNFSEKELLDTDIKILSKICKMNKNLKIKKINKPKLKSKKYDVRFKNNIANEIME